MLLIYFVDSSRRGREKIKKEADWNFIGKGETGKKTEMMESRF